MDENDQNDLRNLTGIGGKNIIFDLPASELKSNNGHKYLIIHAELTYEPRVCQQCGITNVNDTITKKGFKTSIIRTPDKIRYDRYLHLRRQVFYCNACHKTFFAKTELDDNPYFTSCGFK